MKLQTPQNLRLQAVGDGTTIVGFWDPVLAALGYQVEINGTIEMTVPEASFVKFGASLDTTYNVRVRALPDVGNERSDWSAVATIKTGTDVIDPPDPPDPDEPNPLDPPELSLAQRGLDAARATWTVVPLATGYEVQLDGGAIQSESTVAKTFTGLANGQTIAVRVRAVNAASGVKSDWSDTKTLTIEGLSPPENLEAMGASENVIHVRFDPVPAAEGYDVGYDQHGEGADYLVDAPATEVNVSGLLRATSYTFWVRSRAGDAVSDWSEPVSASTLRSGPLLVSAEPNRVSSFPGDHHITARALNAEFNNILVLLAGGSADLTQGSRAPAPSPAPPVPAPMEPPIRVTPYDPGFQPSPPEIPGFPDDPPVDPPEPPDPPPDPGRPPEEPPKRPPEKPPRDPRPPLPDPVDPPVKPL